jgi:hypothetical protein
MVQKTKKKDAERRLYFSIETTKKERDAVKKMAIDKGITYYDILMAGYKLLNTKTKKSK